MSFFVFLFHTILGRYKFEKALDKHCLITVTNWTIFGVQAFQF